MRTRRGSLTRNTLGLILLVTLQVFCSFYFISDVFSSLVGFSGSPIPWELREVLELGVSAGMLISLVLGIWVLWQTLRERNRAEEGLRRAAGAFAALMEERFTDWGLTPAERDVALFAVKGLSMSEIAALRETSEGTVRAQANAIYRKAGVSGRQQLLSHFIDELLSLDNSYGETVRAEAARSGIRQTEPVTTAKPQA